MMKNDFCCAPPQVFIVQVLFSNAWSFQRLRQDVGTGDSGSMNMRAGELFPAITAYIVDILLSPYFFGGGKFLNKPATCKLHTGINSGRNINPKALANFN